MVTTASDYNHPRYRVSKGSGYDGVVKVSSGGAMGTGVLLYDGRTILTAAHVVDSGAGNLAVSFETIVGTQTEKASRVEAHPDYDWIHSNHDLALITLSKTAPAAADRYSLYRDYDEIGQEFFLVGYGTPGTGTTGMLSSYDGPTVKRKAKNEFDADMDTMKEHLGSGMGWTPAPGTQLAADFDDGSQTHDAFGQLIGINGTGLGADEGIISSGDSGGPAFIGSLVAGVASYGASLSKGGAKPDIDDQNNSSFGEIAAWMRVSYYQQWIDQHIRKNFPNTPSKPEEVALKILEGNSGTSYAYFLLQFNGVRSDPKQWLSVDFETRAGTATAGEDYIHASGTLILYPGENQAVIPVEIIGDTTPEPDEYFYLDVFNPVGGSFRSGVTKLTATRTIIDDDGWLA